MIITEKLGKTYVKGRISVQALSDLNLQVNRGEYFSIVGRSGSGKSTLLNLIAGLDRPTTGRLLFNERDLSGFSRNELARHRCFSVGMLFQSFNLIHNRTALENITLALAFGGIPRNRRKIRAMELLARVGLEERAGHRPDELSGGEAQRVAIARALSNDPDLLLADEPTGNLDSHTSAEIIALLQDLNREKGLTLVMVTHDLDTARRVSHRIVRLSDGSVAETIENP